MRRTCANVLRALVVLSASVASPPALADTVAVPATLQANLTAKLLAFDRGLPARAAGTVRVLILTDPSEGQSQKIANEYAAGLKAKPNIAGMPVEITMAQFKSAQALAADVKTKHLSAVYLSSGLGRHAEAIANAVKGLNIMTVAAEPAAVIRGASVGFDLLSGQPKILVNLGQAKHQNIELPASVLSLAVIQGG
jgi:hypothetical protein